MRNKFKIGDENCTLTLFDVPETHPENSNCSNAFSSVCVKDGIYRKACNQLLRHVIIFSDENAAFEFQKQCIQNNEALKNVLVIEQKEDGSNEGSIAFNGKYYTVSIIDHQGCKRALPPPQYIVKGSNVEHRTESESSAEGDPFLKQNLIRTTKDNLGLVETL